MIVFLDNNMHVLSAQTETKYTINMAKNGQGTGEFLLLKAPPAESKHVAFYRKEKLIYRGIISTFNDSTYTLETNELWFFYWSGCQF